MAVLRINIPAGLFRRKRGSIPRSLPRLRFGTKYACRIFGQPNERSIDIRRTRPDRSDFAPPVGPGNIKIDGKTRHGADPVDREDIGYASQH
ncbi:MAG: hypothetical protein V3R90_07490 [Limibaculum sp.]